MFTDIDLELPVRIAGIPMTLIIERQHGRLRWALFGEHWPVWTGWAGDA